MEERHYGVEYGYVLENRDPQGQHRVRLVVPGIYGEEGGPWARPIGVGGNRTGVWNVPAIGTQCAVWFRRGDPQYPLYMPAGQPTGKEPETITAAVEGTPTADRPEMLTQLHVLETRDWEVVVDERPGRRLLRMRAKGVGSEDPDGSSLMIEMDRERGVLALSAPGGVSISTNGGRISIDGLVIDIAGRTVQPANPKPI